MSTATKSVSDSKGPLLFGALFVLLGLSLFICTLVEMRSYPDNANQTIKDTIDSINMLSYIVLFLSVIILLMGLILFLSYKYPDTLFGSISRFIDNISDKIKCILLISVSIVILIITGVQRTKINSILPDTNDAVAVTQFNSNYNLSPSTILGANNAILIMSGVLLLISFGFWWKYGRDPQKEAVVEISRETVPQVEDITDMSDAEKVHLENEKITKDICDKAELSRKPKSGVSIARQKEYQIECNKRDEATKSAWQEYMRGLDNALYTKPQVQQKINTSLPTPVSRMVSSPMSESGGWTPAVAPTLQSNSSFPASIKIPTVPQPQNNPFPR